MTKKQLAVAGAKCECEASPILDENGNYSVEKLKSADFDFWQGLLGGDREVLDPKIDVEEPGAANIISIALNMALQTGMASTHVEMWHAVEAMATPILKMLSSGNP